MVIDTGFLEGSADKNMKDCFLGAFGWRQQTLLVLILHNTGPSKRKDAAETQKENVFRY